MADVTVNIRGDASSLRQEIDDVRSFGSDIDVGSDRPTTSDAGGVDRLIDVVREGIEAGNETKAVVAAVEDAERQRREDSMSAYFDQLRDDLRARASSLYDEVDAKVDARRADLEETYAGHLNDPFYRQYIDTEVENYREKEYERVGKGIDADEEALMRDETEARLNSEAELTDVMRELTDAIKTEGLDTARSDGYIGQLRAEQRALVRERDSAGTREGALDAQARLDAVNERIADVIGGGRGGTAVFDPTSLLMGGFGQLSGLLDGGGSLGDVIGGLGTAGVALTSATLKTALKRLPYVYAAAKTADLISGSGSSRDAAGDLARYRSTSSGANTEARTESIGSYLTSNYSNRLLSQLGLDRDEFAGRAEGLIRARGDATAWYDYTRQAVGVERLGGLDAGAINSAAAFDRYNNGRSALGGTRDLINILSAIPGSGVTNNDFTRVQEKFDIQQGILNSFLGINDRAQFSTANRLLAGFSAVGGITQDRRLGEDIGTFQNALTNPSSDRARALLYNVVGDLFPETGYQTHEIDKLLHNPEEQGRIIQAYVQRIQEVYGGLDTPAGYWSFRSIFPDITPDRLENFVGDLSNPNSTAAGLLNGARGLSRTGAISDDQEEVRQLISWQTRVTDNTLSWAKDLPANLLEAAADLYNKLINGGTPIPVRNVQGGGSSPTVPSPQSGSKQ